MSSTPQSLPSVLPGFENIKRFWDPTREISMAKILPGELYVTTQHEAIATVLGSCVSACIRDADLGIGGMNHFMLPAKGSIYEENTVISEAARYGNWAMEFLINQILKAGGRRRMLEIKVFGGANVLPSLPSMVSQDNINFILNYIYNENLNMKAKDVGGHLGRMVVYYPKTGLVQVKDLSDIRKYKIPERENQYMRSIGDKIAKRGDIELF